MSFKSIVMSKNFRFTEHTADTYIEASGDNLEEVFSNIATGLGFLIIESDNVEENILKNITVESEDLESLLFDFLSEILVFQDSEGLIFHNVYVEKIEKKENKWRLNAKAKGEKFNSKKHEQGTHVKAITYHNMKIKKEKEKFKVRVLVDI